MARGSRHFYNQIAGQGFPVTPTNGLLPQGPCNGLYVGVAGNITVVWSDDETDTPCLLPNVPVGTHPWSVKQVRATGTAQAAGEIVALY